MKQIGRRGPKEDRLRIAERIVELSGKRLLTKINTDHITLKVGPSVAVVISNSDRVGFFIRSKYLLDKAREEGFSPESAKIKWKKDEHKFLFPRLSLGQIDAHEELFREIVDESIATTFAPKNS